MPVQEGDMQLNSNGVIQFKDGDFKLGDAPEQHLAAILNASKGNFRKNPTLGVDIINDLDSPQDVRQLEQKIRVETGKDGYSVKEMQIITDDLEIKNIYIQSAEKVTDNTKSLI